MHSNTFNSVLTAITSITLLFVALVTPSIFVAEGQQQSNGTDQINNFEEDNMTINNTTTENQSLFSSNNITSQEITNTNNFTENNATSSTKRNVIFLHPDGTTQSHYGAVRLLEVGPDGNIHWDNLSNLAIYKGNTKDSLTSTSHGGATIHGSGIKVLADSYGCDGNCTNNSTKRTIMEEARDEGYKIGIINSGTITEPGTGAFVAHVTARSDHCEIVRQIVEESGASLILGAGERYYLSANDTSFHPNPENNFTSDKGDCERNVIDVAKDMGYTVVYNKSQLDNINPLTVNKVLGIFAYDDSYNDISENELFNLGNPGISSIGECDDVCRLYEPYAPTFDEMVQFGIDFLDTHSDKGFILVAEEEGTDNFANNNMNAEGVIEAGRRADRAIGIAREFAEQNPNNTLVLTAADSNAGAFEIFSNQQLHNSEYPVLDNNGCITEPHQFPGLDPLVEQPEDQNTLLDGITDFSIVKAQVNGSNIFCEKPFLAKPDQFGNELFFHILWLPGGAQDVGGGTITRAFGCNAEDVTGTIDNTDLARIMADCLVLEDEIPFEDNN
jgi:alkaline phosphatase